MMHNRHTFRMHTVLPGTLIFIVMLSLVCVARGQDRDVEDKLLEDLPVSIVPQEQWASVFGGKQSVFYYQVGSNEPFNGRVAWRLSVAGRTIARGEAALNLSTSDSKNIAVALEIPPVKDGVVMQASLSINVYTSSDAEVATHTKDVWVWSDDPFAGKTKWLKKRNIHLFDPEGLTSELFEANDIPFDRIYNLNTIADIREGLLIIGEGASFHDYRALAEVLFAVAADGVPVLCLAPVDGEFEIPGTGDGEAGDPAALHLRRADIIKQLDKRLDAAAWPMVGRVASRSLHATGSRGGRVLGVVGEDANGWPWLDAVFESGNVVICGFDIVKNWDTGPTPRFLFARILEYMDKKKQKASEDAK